MFFTFPYVWYIALIFSYISIVAYGSFTMSCNFYLKSFTGNKKQIEKVIALTFDDGPHPEFTPLILQLLKSHKAIATFFCIGNEVDKHPDILQKIKEGGHSIGNHSYSHSTTIDFKRTKYWIDEIEETDSAIKKAIGEDVMLFRPPYGVTTPHLANAITFTKHKVIGWSIRSFDKGIKDPDQILQRIKKQVKPGGIILLHDTHVNAPLVLEHLLLFLQQQGYITVSINQLLDEK
jgi:peptidoglycan/xylan/chitin deacetylase (PgdA/CDA1 family)